jgi:hypothetical protein
MMGGCALTSKILSLWEIMKQHNVWQLVHSVNMIRDLERLLEKQCDESGLRDHFITQPFIDKMVRPCLDYCRDQCKEAELETPLRRLGTVLWGKVNAGAITHEQLRMQLEELRRDIDGDLALRRFAFVPMSKANIYDNRVTAWEAIWKRFPETETDARDCVDAYVLGLNAATVFHAMRVAECGLRALAEKLKVKLTQKEKKPLPIQFAEWNTVITGCQNKINVLRQKAKSVKVNTALNFYSDTAQQCQFLKDIWRNDAAHSRKKYDEIEALGAMSRARDFMQLLSVGMPK